MSLSSEKSDLAVDTDLEEVDESDVNHYLFQDLKSGPGEARVMNIKKVAERHRRMGK